MNNDVIGAALLDYYNKQYDTDIIVKSSISEDDIISIPYLFRTEKEFPELELKALECCKGMVLDVGAGSGCHSIVLQERGFDVTAIDTSPGAVEVMQKRGVKAECMDFYTSKAKYDTLLFLMNGIGIAKSMAHLKVFLNKAKSLLNEGGQLILDSSDIAYMFEEEDGPMWVDLNSAYYGEVTYQMQYKDLITPKFDWLFIDFSRLNTIACDLGFKVELIFKGENNHYLARLLI